MRHATAARAPELFRPDPIRPWDYLRLRREAAGLTIEQAARPFWHRPEHRADCEENLRFFEQTGTVMKRVHDLDIPRAFPFSADVYVQLASLPPEQHPRLCRRCGWDEWTVQPDRAGDDTSWSAEDPTLCTRCEQDLARGGRR